MSEQIDIPASNTRQKTEVKKSTLNYTTPKLKKNARKVKTVPKSLNPITKFLHEKEKDFCYSDSEDSFHKTLRNRSLSGNLYTSSLVIETNAIVANNGDSQCEDMNTSLNSVHDLSAIARLDPANRESDRLNKQTVIVKPSSNDDLDKQISVTDNNNTETDIMQQQSMISVKSPKEIHQTQTLGASVTASNNTMAATITTQTPPSVTTANVGISRPTPVYAGVIYMDQRPHLTSSQPNMGMNMMQDYWYMRGQSAILMAQPPPTFATSQIQTQLNTISASVAQLAKDMHALASSTNDLNQKIDSIQFEQEIETSKVRTHDKRVRGLEDKVSMLIKVVCAQETEITALKTKMQYEEQKNMRNSVIVHGIIKDSDKTCAELAETFFKEDMNPTPAIVTAYRMGNDKDDQDRPMVIKLQNKSAKDRVFENTKSLKDRKNSKNRYFSVRSYMSDKQSEDDYRKGQIVRINKEQPLPHRQNVTLKKGKLLIGTSEYCKKIHSYTNNDLLHLTTDDIDSCKEMRLSVSSKKSDSGSTFIGYCAEVSDIEQVRLFYRHVKIKHADAAHVILAYKIPGVDRIYGEDYIDDGEYGGGRRILKYLIDNDVTS